MYNKYKLHLYNFLFSVATEVFELKHSFTSMRKAI